MPGVFVVLSGISKIIGCPVPCCSNKSFPGVFLCCFPADIGTFFRCAQNAARDCLSAENADDSDPKLKHLISKENFYYEIKIQ